MVNLRNQICSFKSIHVLIWNDNDFGVVICIGTVLLNVLDSPNDTLT